MAEKIASGASTFKKAIQTWVTPDLNDIKSQLGEIRGELRALTPKVDEMDKRLTEGMNSMKNELKAEIRTVDAKVDFAPRIAVLEEKIRELEKQR